ncbi:MAG: MarR family transcriptional regulator [Myxococcota bacterium]
MVDDKFRNALEAAKAASIPQMLFRVARRLNDHALAHVRERAGMPGLRASHTALFPHISLEGSRLTELASSLGISKQAVAQLVDELVEMGVLVRKPDPDDRRAKRIFFAGNGRYLLDGLSLLGEVEAEIRAVLGERESLALLTALTSLLHYLESPDRTPKP